MKVIMTAFLTIVPALLGQNQPQVQILMNQVGPLVGTGAQFVAGEMVGGNPVPGAPYSARAVTESTQTLGDGSHISHNSSSMLYRDSQGRERREMGPMVMISDPVAGSNYTLDPESRTAHKMPMPQTLPLPPSFKKADGDVLFQSGISVSGGLIAPSSEARHVMVYKSATAAKDGNLPAPTVEQLGTASMEGIQAEGTRTTVTIPAGQAGNDRELRIVSEQWYSPDLKMTILSKHNDPRMGATEYRLTQISRSEPSPSLFQVPADYTVVDAPAFFNQKVQIKHEE